MQKHYPFIILLAAMTLALLIYTAQAQTNDPNDIFTVIAANLKGMMWSGQFNADFTCYLILSGLWIMWRKKFSPPAIFTGVVAMLLGIVFFAPYLIYLLYKESGDLKTVLVGDR
jgi:hypothetical protein